MGWGGVGWGGVGGAGRGGAGCGGWGGRVGGAGGWVGWVLTDGLAARLGALDKQGRGSTECMGAANHAAPCLPRNLLRSVPPCLWLPAPASRWTSCLPPPKSARSCPLSAPTRRACWEWTTPKCCPSGACAGQACGAGGGPGGGGVGGCDAQRRGPRTGVHSAGGSDLLLASPTTLAPARRFLFCSVLELQWRPSWRCWATAAAAAAPSARSRRRRWRRTPPGSAAASKGWSGSFSSSSQVLCCCCCCCCWSHVPILAALCWQT